MCSKVASANLELLDHYLKIYSNGGFLGGEKLCSIFLEEFQE